MFPLNLFRIRIPIRYINIVVWHRGFALKSLSWNVLPPCISPMTSSKLLNLPSFVYSLLHQSGFNQRSRISMEYTLRDLLQGISLCDWEGWLPDSEICKAIPWERAVWNSRTPVKVSIQSQDFFFIKETSVLLLRSVNWLN